MTRCLNQDPQSEASRTALADLAKAAHARCAPMGWTWCDCCGAKVTVEDTFPGRVMGCGPFCSQCRPLWESSPDSHFGEGCKHDGSRWAETG
jgi:hypothetical protein